MVLHAQSATVRVKKTVLTAGKAGNVNSDSSTPTDSHWAEAFGLQPGFDLIWRRVVADVDARQAAAARRNLKLLLSAATQSQSVHQLVLNLLHVGLPACRTSNRQKSQTSPEIAVPPSEKQFDDEELPPASEHVKKTQRKNIRILKYQIYFR